MADSVQFELTGLDEALKTMRRLPGDMQKKGFRYATRKAAEVIQQAAIANAKRIDDPETANSIANNIAIRFSNRTFKQSGDILFRVGVQGGAKEPDRKSPKSGTPTETKSRSGNPGGSTYYWRFVEFGTEDVQARPFMRPALDQNVDAATSAFANNLNRWLDNHMKKITRQSKKAR